MTRSLLTIAAVASLLCATPSLGQGQVDPPAATGASIDESAVAVTLHVQAGAEAGGDGAAGSPFGSLEQGLQQAVARLERGEATKVVIHPGVYREGPVRLDFTGGQAATTLLVIEGTDPAAVIWSGSDVWPAEQWEDLGDGLFAHEWTDDWGHFTYNWGPPKTLGHRREMVFLDGQLLKQVELEQYAYQRDKNLFSNPERQWVYEGFTDPRTGLTPGTFGVAERDENGNRLYVRVADPEAFRSGMIEVARRRNLLVLGEKQNLVVRNITFTHAANDFQRQADDTALTFTGSPQNVLLEDLRFVWNNFTGLAVTGRDVTLRRVEASYNGYGGFADGGPNLLLEDCTTNFNNWRGHWGGQYGWNLGGVKFANDGPITIRRHTAVGNLSGGIWFDIHNHDVRVEDSVSALNKGFGLFFELANGPFLAERCLLVHNGGRQYNNSIVGTSELRDSVLYGRSDDTYGYYQVPEATVHLQWYLRNDPHAKRQPLVPDVARVVGNVIVAGKGQPLAMFVNNGVNRADERHAMWSIEVTDNLFHVGKNEAYGYVGPQWGTHFVQLSPFLNHFSGRSNEQADPKFVDPSRLDFRVADDSPVAARRDELPLRQLAPPLLEQAAAWFAWAGLEGPRVTRGLIANDEVAPPNEDE